MEISCTALVFQRERWTGEFQHWSTTTGSFMNASVIPLQMILVAQLCIYLPSPLMIYPPTHKRVWYAPDLLPASISIASTNSVSNLTTPSDSPEILPTDDPNTLHVVNKDTPLEGRVHIGYYCIKHGWKRCYKKTRFYCSTCSDKNKRFYYCHGFSRISSDPKTFFLEHQHYMSQCFSWLLCLSPFYPLLYLLNFFLLVFFLSHLSLPVFFWNVWIHVMKSRSYT